MYLKSIISCNSNSDVCVDLHLHLRADIIEGEQSWFTQRARATKGQSPDSNLTSFETWVLTTYLGASH